eukprot:GHRR01002196.1.p1 GENE.GHRR01002196.1~~GHRR01002196.1.p1  ORF type:complete len:303 (+),score=108.36 GHRR01002196.1:364-1272(+)
MQPGAEQDHAAHFYAKLVDFQPCHADGSLDAAESRPRQDTQQQVEGEQQQHGSFAPSGAAATTASTAAEDLTFRPVRFAEPFVLDPNTVVEVLQPGIAKASTGTHNMLSAASKHQSGSSSRQLQHASANAGNIQHPIAPAAIKTSYKRPIDRGNIGYQLLSRAGWQEGHGLGANGQGRQTPLEVRLNKGNTGLGFQHGNPAQWTQSPARQTGNSAAAAAVAGPVLGAKRVAVLVAEEFAPEDVDNKFKRHRQIILQEAKDKRDKAIQQYLCRAFHEPSTADTGDSNPLGKNHRLTAMNPLLD